MSKMSELSMVLQELKECGEKLVGISEELAEIFSGSEEKEPVKKKPAAKKKDPEAKEPEPAAKETLINQCFLSPSGGCAEPQSGMRLAQGNALISVSLIL